MLLVLLLPQHNIRVVILELQTECCRWQDVGGLCRGNYCRSLLRWVQLDAVCEKLPSPFASMLTLVLPDNIFIKPFSYLAARCPFTCYSNMGFEGHRYTFPFMAEFAK